MRKLLFSLLLASVAATPALAEPDRSDHHWQDRSDRDSARADRQAARAERQERSAPVERVERSAPTERTQFAGGHNGGGNGGQPAFVRPERLQQNVEQADSGERQHRGGRGDGGGNWRNWRSGDGAQATVGDQTLRQNDRPLPNVMRRHDRSAVVSDVPRQGTQPPLRVDNHRRDRVAWNRDWRHDGRYDWHRWRDRHRHTFHLGFYFDPFGWGYQPFSIGYRLWPSYYSSRYWINDPYEYRLPYAPPGYRWVRYYNDAILVDTFSGEVVDVIRDFFW